MTHLTKLKCMSVLLKLMLSTDALVTLHFIVPRAQNRTENHIVTSVCISHSIIDQWALKLFVVATYDYLLHRFNENAFQCRKLQLLLNKYQWNFITGVAFVPHFNVHKFTLLWLQFKRKINCGTISLFKWKNLYWNESLNPTLLVPYWVRFVTENNGSGRRTMGAFRPGSRWLYQLSCRIVCLWRKIRSIVEYIGCQALENDCRHQNAYSVSLFREMVNLCFV